VTFRFPPVSEVVLAVQFSEPVVDLEVLAGFALGLATWFVKVFLVLCRTGWSWLMSARSVSGIGC